MQLLDVNAATETGTAAAEIAVAVATTVDSASAANVSALAALLGRPALHHLLPSIRILLFFSSLISLGMSVWFRMRSRVPSLARHGQVPMGDISPQVGLSPICAHEDRSFPEV